MEDLVGWLPSDLDALARHWCAGVTSALIVLRLSRSNRSCTTRRSARTRCGRSFDAAKYVLLLTTVPAPEELYRVRWQVEIPTLTFWTRARNVYFGLPKVLGRFLSGPTSNTSYATSPCLGSPMGTCNHRGSRCNGRRRRSERGPCDFGGS